jgi:hypothetical protein
VFGEVLGGNVNHVTRDPGLCSLFLAGGRGVSTLVRPGRRITLKKVSPASHCFHNQKKSLNASRRLRAKKDGHI